MQHSAIVREFSRLIQSRSGIRVAEHRDHLLQNRAMLRMEALQLKDLQDYFDLVMRETSGDELSTLIDSIATNFTSFFRDPRQFSILDEELTRQANQSHKPIRIWSAACSTGQEVYSIAICAFEVAQKLKIPANRFRILGTDISTDALRYASRACYNEVEIAQLEDRYRAYFTRLPDQPDWWQIHEEIRRMVILRRMNLCDLAWKVRDSIDCIFLRNVLIYFQPEVQNRILEQALSKLSSTGLLFLGACESKRAQLGSQQYVAPAVFRREKSTSTNLQGGHDE